MKGKLSTKTVVIGIITVVLLAVATTGTVLFLKDSGEAAAMDEQNTILPVAGNDATSSNVEQSEGNNVENPTVNPENQEIVNSENTVEATGVTPTQNTRVLTEEPEVSVVEREKVVSEEKTLGWTKIGLANNIGAIDINYKNLKYKVEYYSVFSIF